MAYTVLALGSLGLSLVFAFLAWETRRTIRLRSDLLMIRLDLQKKVESLGCLDDKEYRWYANALYVMIENPRLLDWSWLVAVSAIDPKITVTIPETDNPMLRTVLDEAKNERTWRHVGHLMYETTTGLVARSIIWILPNVTKPAAERRARRVAKRYCEKADRLGAPSGWMPA